MTTTTSSTTTTARAMCKVVFMFGVAFSGVKGWYMRTHACILCACAHSRRTRACTEHARKRYTLTCRRERGGSFVHINVYLPVLHTTHTRCTHTHTLIQAVTHGRHSVDLLACLPEKRVMLLLLQYTNCKRSRAQTQKTPILGSLAIEGY